MWYDSIYITVLKWQNYKDGKQISDCQGLKKGVYDLPWVRMREFFLEMEQFCIWIVMVVLQIHTWDKITTPSRTSLPPTPQTQLASQAKL